MVDWPGRLAASSDTCRDLASIRSLFSDLTIQPFIQSTNLRKPLAAMGAVAEPIFYGLSAGRTSPPSGSRWRRRRLHHRIHRLTAVLAKQIRLAPLDRKNRYEKQVKPVVHPGPVGLVQPAVRATHRLFVDSPGFGRNPADQKKHGEFNGLAVLTFPGLSKSMGLSPCLL